MSKRVWSLSDYVIVRVLEGQNMARALMELNNYRLFRHGSLRYGTVLIWFTVRGDILLAGLRTNDPQDIVISYSRLAMTYGGGGQDLANGKSWFDSHIRLSTKQRG
jgi:hypothetical protein